MGEGMERVEDWQALTPDRQYIASKVRGLIE
jgi:hypothetical protein